ncbi:MAG: hypothetical protein KA163_03690 [Bacteroidia bacterium]|nr:hypothetical protein [Bacteroidia bacterium]
MKKKAGILFSLVVLLHFISPAQTLKYEFIKNCLTYQDIEIITDLTARNFNFVAKDHINLGDPLINRSDYYSSKKENSTDTAEIAVFINKRKSSKKSVVFSFVETQAFANYNAIEAKIQSNLKKEASFKSDKFDADVTKYSFDKYFYYLFKDDYMWYIITSNYDLEEKYFSLK